MWQLLLRQCGWGRQTLALSTVMVGEGRPSTSLPAKGWIFLVPDWPQALWSQSKKMGHGGRGGIPEITEEKGR